MCRKQKEDDFTRQPIAMVKCDFHHKICLETQIVPLVLGATTTPPPHPTSHIRQARQC